MGLNEVPVRRVKNPII